MVRDAAELAAALVGWYRGARRDLPWRRSRDPWAIWVSEVMLQQTRVEAVRGAWARFLGRFPDPASLAAADDDALLTAWKGLGYYRRVRLLREGARRVVADHGGRVPEDPDSFGALPGVGPYTKGAVLSIGRDLPLPAIDGNVGRVLGRLLALETDPGRAAARAPMHGLIADLHRHASPGEVNQGLMEVGATLCLPRRPSCRPCPLRDACKARLAGRTGELPHRPARRRPIEVTTRVCLVRRGGRVLAGRVPAGEVNEGQLCLPGLGIPVPAAADLGRHLEDRYGLTGRVGDRLATLRHSITRYRITVEAYAFEPTSIGRGLAFEDPADARLPWTTVARKLIGGP